MRDGKTRRVLAAVAAGMAVVTAISAVSPVAVASTATSTTAHAPSTDVAAVQHGLDQLTGADGVPGALARIDDPADDPITLTSGTAQVATERPMPGARGRFRIASVTKTFTAVAVLRLVAEGQVRLDDPVETYLPGVLQGTGEGAGIDGRHITVRQLLQHTSGLPNYTQYVDLRGWDRPVTAAELVALALTHRPDFAPGQGWNYSNTGYLVAGMLVERVTGQDFGTVVTERVIRPAGLRDTYWPPAGERTIRGPHARNYLADPANPLAPLADVTEFEPSLAGAAGALVSTPADLEQFWAALFGGRLLPWWAVAEMRRTVPMSDDYTGHFGRGSGYGLGLLRVPLSCGGFTWGHGGDLLGVSTMTGRADNGHVATVYITAQTGSDATARHMLDTVDSASCVGRVE